MLGAAVALLSLSDSGAEAVDIVKTIYPHPKLGKSIGMAAEIAHGSCTDVPPARK
jgi:dihydrolipoamide dehydrogenase